MKSKKKKKGYGLGGAMELNREQIVKALECCIYEKACRLCPLNDYSHDAEGCKRELMKHALALIRDLDAEKERYKAAVATEFTCIFGTPHKVSDCPITEEVAKAKADTVRKMQERFYEKTGRIQGAYFRGVIDQIAKELLEEG